MGRNRGLTVLLVLDILCDHAQWCPTGGGDEVRVCPQGGQLGLEVSDIVVGFDLGHAPHRGIIPDVV